jgi:primosomal replication protein N
MLPIRLARYLVCALVPLLLITLAWFPNRIVRADDEDEFEFTGAISALPNTANFVGDWMVGSRTVHVTSMTRIEQDGGAPAIGKTAEVEGKLNHDGTISATEIEIKAPRNFEFQGRVDQLPMTTGFTGDWIVSGRTVHVTSATTIDQTQKALAVGVMVKVVGTLRMDGTIDATRIETLPTQQLPFFEFTGTVQSLPATPDLLGDWMVGTRTVHVTSMTKIETEDGPITVGTMVEVKGFVRADGSIDAAKIEPVENPPNAIEFRGMITNLPTTPGFIGDWTIEGHTVHVSSTTRIQQEEGLVAVGALVEVRGTIRADGSVDAARIEVEESAGSLEHTPRVEIEGMVQQLPSSAGLIGDWMVNGSTIHVNSLTRIRPSAAAITVGSFVEIEGFLRPDNSVDAVSAELERPETPSFSLLGLVDTLPTTAGFIGDWVVSGRTVHVVNATQINTNHRPLVVGSLVKITGPLQTDGTINAQRIDVKRNDDVGPFVNFFELFGTVGMVPSPGPVGDWQIGNLTVHVTATTRFAPPNTMPVVGSRVKVVGVLQNDGTLTADAIVLQGDVDDSHDFVREHFEDFLSRDPDDSGFAFWVRNIDQCGSDDNCRRVMRVNTSAAFFMSIEFQHTGFLIERLFVASFGRLPRFAEFIADEKTISQGVIVGQAGWQQKLAANTQAFIDDWVHHPAFVAAFGSLTNAQYVDALLKNASLTLAAADRQALIDGLNNGTLTRAQVLQQIVDNPTFIQQETNRAFVLMQFFGFLRRDPDDAPDGDMKGFNFWLNKLNQFHGDFQAAEMVRAFIESAEFRRRFGK